jgi:hypothetical protein
MDLRAQDDYIQRHPGQQTARVAVDIKPDDANNAINLNSHGTFETASWWAPARSKQSLKRGAGRRRAPRLAGAGVRKCEVKGKRRGWRGR